MVDPVEYTTPHLPTENSGECSTCLLPWPCPVAITWEQAHAVFCSRAQPDGLDVCSTHLRPGDRYLHVYLFDRPPPSAEFEVTRLWCEEHQDPCCVQDHEPTPVLHWT